ncbi:trypsin-like serine peptidase [Mucilaginibacter sp.]|uniref:trypsin-like serine peptidase n=1 Tax=Mucilaginibacter sp. TaxID=1882438 RepID=UPI003D0F3C69
MEQSEIEQRLATSLTHIEKLATLNQTPNIKLVELKHEIEQHGKEQLQQLEQRDVIALNKNANAELLLEAIVMTDGSRPAFLIAGDRVDLDSNPKGNWKQLITVSGSLLEDAITCVGRIESAIYEHRYYGTGFLIADDLLMTNLHVLQAIATLNTDGHWQLKPTMQVNFGREKNGHQNKNIRLIIDVVYYGPSSGAHGKVDTALLKLNQVKDEFLPRKLISPSPDLPAANEIVYVIGYPGPSEPGTYSNWILNQLFADGYGYKRLSPGIILPPGPAGRAIRFTHDATTMGGNSGSPVIQATSMLTATGLHYAGSPGRANFAHALAAIKSITGGPNNKQFSEILGDYGI